MTKKAGEADPVVALVDKYEADCAEYNAKRASGAELPEDVRDALFKTMTATEAKLMQVRPTSAAGAGRLLDAALHELEDEDLMSRDDWVGRLTYALIKNARDAVKAAAGD